MSACIIEQILYSSGAAGTGEPVRFTKYGRFHIPGVLIVYTNALVWKCNWDQTKCLQHRRRLLFRNIHRAGFHCIWCWYLTTET